MSGLRRAISVCARGTSPPRHVSPAGFPYGTEVTVGLLGRIDRAEAALHRLGFRQVRVRHYDETARIEVDLAEVGRVIDEREAVVAAVKSAGYRYVTVDLEGFRSGNLNG